MYDSVIANVLTRSNEISFLSYNKLQSIRRTPVSKGNFTTDSTKGGAGLKLCEINIEIDSI